MTHILFLCRLWHTRSRSLRVYPATLLNHWLPVTRSFRGGTWLSLVQENESGSAGDRSPSDRSGSRHDDDGDRRKEKRKSKKHKRKSDRKKHRRSSKTEPSSGPEQESGDEGNSSDEDEVIEDYEVAGRNMLPV